MHMEKICKHNSHRQTQWKHLHAHGENYLDFCEGVATRPQHIFSTLIAKSWHGKRRPWHTSA